MSVQLSDPKFCTVLPEKMETHVQYFAVVAVCVCACVCVCVCLCFVFVMGGGGNLVHHLFFQCLFSFYQQNNYYIYITCIHVLGA